ncbi:hypothetical protein ATY35_05490 [Vibrio cidicii]|uniref:Uncharacterized protein n=2 Tax=Vibrio cidicii TaxID=1763883 RepID=A0ABR5VXZ5_9VIBR|nr:hypothetical protein [Vibrio tarriae]EHD1698801.1 hypothetical protein [Vibrio vulnificus]KYN82710.1 hypothetical protein ATY35_05490 [Vibrio cidicii]RBM31331.1 hypothetical protein DLR59_00815 [Vibrio tarriae]
MINNHLERSYSTRKGRPLQTMDNIILALHRHGARFEYRGNATHMTIQNRSTDSFERQVQIVVDICTTENFYRDGLKTAIRFALGEMRGKCADAFYSQKETRQQEQGA